MTKKRASLTVKPLQMARTAARAAEEKKSTGTCILDLRGLSPITDYFVICSVESEVQARAVADHAMRELADLGIDVWHVEGYEKASWILLDYVDVVMHIFDEETREFYALDRLWGDAPQVTVRAVRRPSGKA